MIASIIHPAIAARWLLAFAALATVGCVHAREVEAPAAGPSPALEQDPSSGDSSLSKDSVFRDGAIAFIQGALQNAGYKIPITGQLDDATTSALLAFQKQKNLARTGLPDQETLLQLGLEPEALYASRAPAS